MNVVALYKLACAYGHGIGFTIGLFFPESTFYADSWFLVIRVHGTAGVAEMKFGIFKIFSGQKKSQTRQ